MKSILFAFLMIFVLFSITGAKKTLQPWPVNEESMKLAFEEVREEVFEPKLIPFDRAIQYMKQNPYHTLAMDELPKVKSMGMEENRSLIRVQSPVKNQGKRGQCHNFAVTAAMEFSVWAGEGEAYDFSEQCNAWKFFYECDNCLGDPESDEDGGWPSKEALFVYDKFMKFEKDFKYSKTDASKCKSSYNDTPYKQFSDIYLFKHKHDQIKSAIDNNLVVAVSTLWHMKGWGTYGVYDYEDFYPACTTSTCGAHAVLIVGYDDHYYGQNKGGYIFKNSWGTWWGWRKGSKPAGYGVFPYTYIKQYGYEFIAITHKNAPPDPLAFPGCSGK